MKAFVFACVALTALVARNSSAAAESTRSQRAARGAPFYDGLNAAPGKMLRLCSASDRARMGFLRNE